MKKATGDPAVAALIRRRRDETGMTQAVLHAELVKRLGRNPGQNVISEYERAQYGLSLEVARALAAILGLDVAALAPGSDEPVSAVHQRSTPSHVESDEGVALFEWAQTSTRVAEAFRALTKEDRRAVTQLVLSSRRRQGATTLDNLVGWAIMQVTGDVVVTHAPNLARPAIEGERPLPKRRR